MGLYTFLYGNPLYRLYTTGIQPPLLVPARLSRYTAHTAHTAIQPYTPYIIQRYTASLSRRGAAAYGVAYSAPMTARSTLLEVKSAPHCCPGRFSKEPY